MYAAWPGVMRPYDHVAAFAASEVEPRLAGTPSGQIYPASEVRSAASTSSISEATSSNCSRALAAARRTALPPTNVPRDANVPVHRGDESVLVLSSVTHSYGTPIVSA